MGSELLTFLASLAAVAAVVVFAHFLGFSRSAVLQSEDEARELLRLAPGGFEPAHILLDESGGAALAVDGDGKALALIPHGQRHIALLVQTARADGRTLCIETAAPGQRLLTIVSAEPLPGWVRQLADAR